MFDEALQQHEINIVSAPAESHERKRNLIAGRHWANDATERVDDEIRQSVVQFRRHKAEENLPVADVEKPHEIQLQLRRAAIYLAGGWSAILAEIVIATVTIMLMVSAYDLSPWLSTIIAFGVATLLTVLIARLIHAAILILVERSGNPLESRRRVRKWFVRPSFTLVLLTIMGYIALQRLDAETLLALHPIISGLMFVGMLGFVFLGASLLVVAALLSWSRPAAVHYEELLTLREQITSKQEQWQEELNEFEAESEELSLDLHSTAPAKEALTQREPSHEVSVARAAGTKAAALLLLAGLALGSNACVPTQTIKAEPISKEITLDLVVDASGVTNPRALNEAGEHLRQSVQPIVEQQGVTNLRVSWFGFNGWITQERLNIRLTTPPHFVSNNADVSEISKLRPDLEKAKKSRDEKAIADATASANNQLRTVLEKELAPLTIETLIPGPQIESPCTDLNGTFARFTNRTSVDRQLVAIITDGRQNCRTAEIKPITWQRGLAVVIIVVPGTETDGLNDYETRRSKFAASCPWCVIVPHHREDIDAIVAEAVKKSETYTLNETN